MRGYQSTHAVRWKPGPLIQSRYSQTVHKLVRKSKGGLEKSKGEGMQKLPTAGKRWQKSKGGLKKPRACALGFCPNLCTVQEIHLLLQLLVAGRHLGQLFDAPEGCC